MGLSGPLISQIAQIKTKTKTLLKHATRSNGVELWKTCSHRLGQVKICFFHFLTVLVIITFIIFYHLFYHLHFLSFQVSFFVSFSFSFFFNHYFLKHFFMFLWFFFQWRKNFPKNGKLQLSSSFCKKMKKIKTTRKIAIFHFLENCNFLRFFSFFFSFFLFLIICLSFFIIFNIFHQFHHRKQTW